MKKEMTVLPAMIWRFTLLLLLCMATACGTARADVHKNREAAFASGPGNIAYLAAGVALPLLQDGKEGKARALRVADVLVSSTGVCEAIKLLVHDKRPNGSNLQSFPSGHATAAFAVAAAESHYHPHQALLWYGGAAIIARSRLTLREHDIDDVVVGAGLGYFMARWSLSRHEGLVLIPLAHGIGVHVGRGF